MQLPLSSLLKSAKGVTQATKSTEEDIEPVMQLLSSYAVDSEDGDVTPTNQSGTRTPTFEEWQSIIRENPTSLDETSLHIASLAIAISHIRESCRQNQPLSQEDTNNLWTTIYNALTSQSLSCPLFAASRSAQGLLAVPLCSLLKDGSIDELIRLHVWMPDGKRGNPDFALHSHQPFAQSWILAGEGLDHAFDVERVDEGATHAGYALAWDDGKGRDSSYKTHQAYSVVRNTGELFRATEVATERHVRGDSYSVPAAAYHATEVAVDELHATLFFFDSYRGFVKDAGVLGPKNGESYKQLRDPAGITPAELARAVEAVRKQEMMVDGTLTEVRSAL
ncbi:hypothetical protein CSOJ01_07471 [Colletotrichum sojae]|uniref:Uncharacterized protein n=1 Tax=Colletotrichum sojae TaxID=2175907 RepID=A0A8H6J8W2_9PEZI|nr:hypothetical protein CSOJ01_07471 [Colletotrichum sojae]